MELARSGPIWTLFQNNMLRLMQQTQEDKEDVFNQIKAMKPQTESLDKPNKQFRYVKYDKNII